MGGGASVPKGSSKAVNQDMSFPSSSYAPPCLCYRYSFSEIEEATNGFENLIGKGGEGEVFKGVTKKNIPVAVKCLKPGRSSDFEKEIKMLSDLNHPNLVSLNGYCHESNKKIIVYEFMSNGNLADNIYGTSTTTASSLSWKQRLNICIGVGRGLSYLHTPTNMSPEGIVHRDVKPANILLDENFNAKISDFGLAKMGPQDQSNSAVKGTRGYYAPEYLNYGQMTGKIDVYAFGKVLIELLCKKKPWDLVEMSTTEYGEWAKENVDSDLEGEIAPRCLKEFAYIIEKCLILEPECRPSMNDVVKDLELLQRRQEEWELQMSEGVSCLPCITTTRWNVEGSSQEEEEQLVSPLNRETGFWDKLKVKARKFCRSLKIKFFRLKRMVARGHFKKLCLYILFGICCSPFVIVSIGMITFAFIVFGAHVALLMSVPLIFTGILGSAMWWVSRSISPPQNN